MEEEKFKILCPFCNHVYDADLTQDFYDTSNCDTCGSYIEGKIEIQCSKCKKIVYKKEYV